MLEKLLTEQLNPESAAIDTLPTDRMPAHDNVDSVVE